jgi:hypothetical protein
MARNPHVQTCTLWFLALSRLALTTLTTVSNPFLKERNEKNIVGVLLYVPELERKRAGSFGREAGG